MSSLQPLVPSMLVYASPLPHPSYDPTQQEEAESFDDIVVDIDLSHPETPELSVSQVIHIDCKNTHNAHVYRPFSTLATDILSLCFSYLPVVHFITARHTCRHWYAVSHKKAARRGGEDNREVVVDPYHNLTLPSLLHSHPHLSALTLKEVTTNTHISSCIERALLHYPIKFSIIDALKQIRQTITIQHTAPTITHLGIVQKATGGTATSTLPLYHTEISQLLPLLPNLHSVDLTTLLPADVVVTDGFSSSRQHPSREHFHLFRCFHLVPLIRMILPFWITGADLRCITHQHATYYIEEDHTGVGAVVMHRQPHTGHSNTAVPAAVPAPVSTTITSPEGAAINHSKPVLSVCGQSLQFLSIAIVAAQHTAISDIISVIASLPHLRSFQLPPLNTEQHFVDTFEPAVDTQVTPLAACQALTELNLSGIRCDEQVLVTQVLPQLSLLHSLHIPRLSLSQPQLSLLCQTCPVVKHLSIAESKDLTVLSELTQLDELSIDIPEYMRQGYREHRLHLHTLTHLTSLTLTHLPYSQLEVVLGLHWPVLRKLTLVLEHQPTLPCPAHAYTAALPCYSSYCTPISSLLGVADAQDLIQCRDHLGDTDHIIQQSPETQPEQAPAHGVDVAGTFILETSEEHPEVSSPLPTITTNTISDTTTTTTTTAAVPTVSASKQLPPPHRMPSLIAIDITADCLIANVIHLLLHIPTLQSIKLKQANPPSPIPKYPITTIRPIFSSSSDIHTSTTNGIPVTHPAHERNIHDSTLLFLSLLPQLHELHLCDLSELTNAVFPVLSCCQNLTRLLLEQCDGLKVNALHEIGVFADSDVEEEQDVDEAEMSMVEGKKDIVVDKDGGISTSRLGQYQPPLTILDSLSLLNCQNFPPFLAGRMRRQMTRWSALIEYPSVSSVPIIAADGEVDVDVAESPRSDWNSDNDEQHGGQSARRRAHSTLFLNLQTEHVHLSLTLPSVTACGSDAFSFSSNVQILPTDADAVQTLYHCARVSPYPIRKFSDHPDQCTDWMRIMLMPLGYLLLVLGLLGSTGLFCLGLLLFFVLFAVDWAGAQARILIRNLRACSEACRRSTRNT